MTYTEMWSSLSSPKTKTQKPYKNLTPKESGYMDALALVIEHWPEEYQSSDLDTHGYIKGDSCYSCLYQFVLNIYSELHTKECGE